MWWRHATATFIGVSFGSYMNRRRDVLMGRRGCVPLRRVGDEPLRRRWVFHLRLVWDVVETYHWDILATFHWEIVGCFIWDVPATSLGHTERRRYDVATMSCCRVGYMYIYIYIAYSHIELIAYITIFSLYFIVVICRLM